MKLIKILAMIIIVSYLSILIGETFFLYTKTESKAVVTGKNKTFNSTAIQEVNVIFVQDLKKSVNETRYKETEVGDTIIIIKRRGTIIGLIKSTQIK